MYYVEICIQKQILNYKDMTGLKIGRNTPIAALTVGQYLDLMATQTPKVVQVEKPQSNIVGIEGAEEITGYSRAAIYQMTKNRQIPFYKSASNGRKLIFKRDELERWVASRRFQTTQEFVEENL